MGKQVQKIAKLNYEIEKLEIELDTFNKKYRELKDKYKLALELIQKIDPTQVI